MDICLFELHIHTKEEIIGLVVTCCFVVGFVAFLVGMRFEQVVRKIFDEN